MERPGTVKLLEEWLPAETALRKANLQSHKQFMAMI